MGLFIYFRARMKRAPMAVCLMLVLVNNACLAQTAGNTENVQQLWFGYFTQTRFSNKWGASVDLQLRTKENFTDQFSQDLFRGGLTYYIRNNTKLTLGYAYASFFPGDNHTKITQPEHRPWQQFQWHTAFTKSRLMQRFRLEERYRRIILNDSTLGNGYNYNWRFRYNILYEIPLAEKASFFKKLWFVANEEIFINFGKEIVHNYFDQNRLFIGFKYEATTVSSLQAGYMNVFQELSSGTHYKNINVIRISFFQSFDIRKKENSLHSLK